MILVQETTTAGGVQILDIVPGPGFPRQSLFPGRVLILGVILALKGNVVRGSMELTCLRKNEISAIFGGSYFYVG